MGLTKKDLQETILARKETSLLNNFKLKKTSGSIHFDVNPNSFYKDSITLVMKSRYGSTIAGSIFFRRTYIELENEINKITSITGYLPDEAYTISKGYGSMYDEEREYDIKNIHDLNYVTTKFYEVIETNYASFFNDYALFKNIYQRIVNINLETYGLQTTDRPRTYDLHLIFIRYIANDMSYIKLADFFKKKLDEQIMFLGGYNTVADFNRLNMINSIVNIDELLLRINSGNFKELKEKYTSLLK